MNSSNFGSGLRPDPKFDEFNKSFETDIDSNKQDNLSMGYELDVNNTLRRTFSNMINQLQTSKTVSQQSNFFSTNNLNYQEPITNEITFRNYITFTNDITFINGITFLATLQLGTLQLGTLQIGTTLQLGRTLQLGTTL